MVDVFRIKVLEAAAQLPICAQLLCKDAERRGPADTAVIKQHGGGICGASGGVEINRNHGQCARHHGVGDSSSVCPDNFWHVQYLLDRPGNQEVQLEIFLDYGTNVGEYPKWQALFREYQPPALLLWGKNDVIFPEDGAHPYKRDLENLEFHLLDTGHFALEEYGDEIAERMNAFLARINS